jgi:ESCRT-II complex subunit VPS36
MMIVGNVCRRCGGREPRLQTISTPTTSPSAPHAGAANAVSGPAKAPAQSPAAALQPALAVAAAPAATPASAPVPRPVSAFDFGRLQEFDATVDVGDAAKTVLPSGDVFVFSTAPVDVTDGTEKRGHGGRLVLTSQRVLWASGALKLAWPLGALRDPVLEAPSLFSLFHAPHVFLPVIDAEGHAGKAPCVKLSFKGGSDAANAASVFVTSLTSARASLSCATAAAARDARALAAPAATVDGVAGLRRRDERARAEALQLARSPIVHLEDLRARIGPLMKYVAEASAEVRAARERSGVTGDADDEGLASLLADVGAIGTPITRALAGRHFIDALAREVAREMRRDLDASGGLLPLSEVYCAYNRRRGHDVVSPDDLLAAVARMPALGLGMAVRDIQLDARARSVLALDELDDGRLVETLRGIVERAGSVSAIDVAAAMRASVAVATAHLRLAEARGAVARDESVEGVRFFVNRFGAR